MLYFIFKMTLQAYRFIGYERFHIKRWGKQNLIGSEGGKAAVQREIFTQKTALHFEKNFLIWSVFFKLTYAKERLLGILTLTNAEI